MTFFFVEKIECLRIFQAIIDILEGKEVALGWRVNIVPGEGIFLTQYKKIVYLDTQIYEIKYNSIN